MALNKYMYALGRGIRGVKQALEDGRDADPAQTARDVTPAQQAADYTPPAAPAQPPQQPEVESPPLPRGILDLGGHALVMGIVNVTPDSFSDGGRWLDPAAAIAHGEQLAREGADILDIGGESTRPNAAPVSSEDEIARIVPVIHALARSTRAHLSIDTMKATVARAAIEAGANIVNDVWGFQFDPDIARVVADSRAFCILMHNRRVEDPDVDIYSEVVDFLSRSVDIAETAGVDRCHIIIDPGIGFGKSHAQSFELMERLLDLREHFNLPVLLGASRKRCIGAASGVEIASERVAGSIAAHLWGALNCAAIVRVHDVAPHVQALRVLRAIEQAGKDRASKDTQ